MELLYQGFVITHILFSPDVSLTGWVLPTLITEWGEQSNYNCGKNPRCTTLPKAKPANENINVIKKACPCLKPAV